MRRILLASVAAVALTIGSSALRASPYDDQPGPDWRPASELQSQLTSQGWQVDRIKADDGQWEVYGRDPSGNYVEAKYNPYTFQQTKLEYKSGPKPGSTSGSDWRPASELQSQLTSQGWQVDRIKADDGQWEVYGRDPNGRYVEAKYDPYTLQQTNLKVKSGNLQSPGSSGQKSGDRSKGKDRNKSKERKSS